MQILKFGGTSMTDHTTWKNVLEIIGREKNPVVVVSATARTTRQLLQAAERAAAGNLDEAFTVADGIMKRHKQIIDDFSKLNGARNEELLTDCTNRLEKKIGELRRYLTDIEDIGSLSLKSRDAVASIGEQISSYLLAKCGQITDLSTTFVDAKSVIKTDSDFGAATPNLSVIRQRSELLRAITERGEIPIIGGYYGENELGELTTLGFEGSDFTAGLLGEALDAKSVTIWTDVSGIYTCDPRVVPDAKPIPEISFREATEMAYFGAKVLHPSTLKPAVRKQIPVYVKNLFDADHPGTRIFNTAADNGNVRAVTYRENCVIITVTAGDNTPGYQFLASVFNLLKNYHLPVDVVNTTEDSVIIALEQQPKVNELIQQFSEIGDVGDIKEAALISLIGSRVSTADQIQALVLSSIPKEEIEMISFSRSKKHLSLVISRANVIESVKSIHRTLFS
jgi:aspartate kinase